MGKSLHQDLVDGDSDEKYEEETKKLSRPLGYLRKDDQQAAESPPAEDPGDSRSGEIQSNALKMGRKREDRASIDALVHKLLTTSNPTQQLFRDSIQDWRRAQELQRKERQVRRKVNLRNQNSQGSKYDIAHLDLDGSELEEEELDHVQGTQGSEY